VPVTVGKNKLHDLPVETLPLQMHSLGTGPTWSRSTAINIPTVSSLATDSEDEGTLKPLVKRSTTL
jgi:hypothetical protein